MKRVFDIVLATVCIVLFFPLAAMLLVLIPLESWGSPIFAQMRVGRGGKIFTLYKFRSMRTGAMPIGLSQAALREHDKSRLTRIGKVIRRGFDEYPQLFQVLLGQMSVVGPRPLPPSMVNSASYSPITDGFKPGLTSLHVLYLHAVDARTMRRRRRLDGLYAKRRNFCLDLWIIVATPLALWRRSNY